jgi:hypothetical protein
MPQNLRLAGTSRTPKSQNLIFAPLGHICDARKSKLRPIRMAVQEFHIACVVLGMRLPLGPGECTPTPPYRGQKSQAAMKCQNSHTIDTKSENIFASRFRDCAIPALKGFVWNGA